MMDATTTSNGADQQHFPPNDINKVTPVIFSPKMHALSPTRKNHQTAHTPVRDMQGAFEGVGISEMTLAHAGITDGLS